MRLYIEWDASWAKFIVKNPAILQYIVSGLHPISTLHDRRRLYLTLDQTILMYDHPGIKWFCT